MRVSRPWVVAVADVPRRSLLTCAWLSSQASISACSTGSASALCGVAFTAAGFSIVGARRASDDLEAVTLALRQSLATADAVVLSGGVSAGAYDFVPAAVTAV